MSEPIIVECDYCYMTFKYLTRNNNKPPPVKTYLLIGSWVGKIVRKKT